MKNIKQLGKYIDGHAWTHWCVACLYWAAFLGLYELGSTILAAGAK